MAQFIPTVPGIGAALGTGLSKSLETLAEAKIKKMVEQPQQEKLAQLFSYLSGAPAEQAQPSIDQLAGQNQQQTPQPQLQQQQQQLQAQPRQLDRETFQKMLATLPPHLQAQAVAAYQGQQAKIAERQKEERKEQLLDQREINKRTQPFYEEVVAKGKSAQNNIKRAKRLEDLSLKGSLPPAELYKFLSKIEEVPSTAGGAIGATIGGVLGGLAGSVGGPAGAIAGAATGGAKGAGWGGAIGGLIGPIASTLKTALARGYSDTEEFEKLSADFLKDAKGIFGGRITNADLTAFFQTVPTLNQTQHGRLKIIKNMRAFNEAAIAEYEALEEVIKENGGKRPDNLAFVVQRRAQDKIDKAAKEFEV